MPSKSENYGHAIVEGLQNGLPVITSNHTPWNQLEQKMAGKNVNIDTNEILVAINYFASMNQEMYVTWRNAALNYAAEKVNRNAIIQEHLHMFSEKNQIQKC